MFAAHTGFTQTGLWLLTPGIRCVLTFGEPVVSFALSNALQDCFFFCACWSCWVAKNNYCCFIASVARGSVKQLLPRNRELVCAPLVPIRATFPQVPKRGPLHIARLEVHKTALNVYSHPSALCRTTQNWVEVLLEHSIWLFEIQI